MARLDFYLVITMVISLIWGIFVLAIGAMVFLSFGQLIGNYVEGVTSDVELAGATNKAGQNIVPVDTNISNDVDLGNWVHSLGGAIILSGGLMIIFSGIGFIAGLKRLVPLLILVILCIIGALGVQYYLIRLSTDESSSFHDEAREQLMSKLVSEYKIEGMNDMFTTTMNAIMLTGQCCGIMSMKDFGNLTFVDKSDQNKVYTFKVPPACCKRSLFKGDPTSVYMELIKCAEEGYASNVQKINTEGCYNVVYNYIKDKYGVVIMLGLICLAVWEMLQLVLAVLLIFTPPPPPPKPVKKPSITAEEEEKKPKPKVFIPYSKISSFQHPDVNRIKSTEIW